MRKILIELEIDWEGYDDVADELIVQDAIQARVDGVGWKLLRQPPDSGSLQDRLFELANDFAVAKKGEVAVKLHSIHNGLQ
jgi:hypothetical protein